VFSQEWQIKEISRGNVPVWWYDHAGRLQAIEMGSKAWRGGIAATTG